MKHWIGKFFFPYVEPTCFPNLAFKWITMLIFSTLFDPQPNYLCFQEQKEFCFTVLVCVLVWHNLVSWSGIFFLLLFPFSALQMGNVRFCCWNANRVCNWLRLCWSSKDPSLEFRNTRSGMIHWQEGKSHQLFPVAGASVDTFSVSL